MTAHGELQQKVLSFIKEYISSEGKAPTLKEIAQALNVKSTAAVLFHIKSLEKRGLISRTHTARGLTPTEDLDFSRIPVLGIANASTPLAQAEQSHLGYLQIDHMIIRNNGNLFAVKINGDSMNRQSINESDVLLKHGNYAIIDRNAPYKQGDVVLAVVNGGATIKIYMETTDAVILMPNSTNHMHHPIYVKQREQLVINGKVIMALENPQL